MNPAFSRAIADMNTAVVGMLSNVTTILGGVEVQACFESAYALGKVGNLGMASNAPSLVLLSSDTPADPVGLVAVVDGVSYLVASHEPDGTGMTRLWLEQA